MSILCNLINYEVIPIETILFNVPLAWVQDLELADFQAPFPGDRRGLRLDHHEDDKMAPMTKTVGGRGKPSSSTRLSGTFKAGSISGSPDPVANNRVGRVLGIPESVKASALPISEKDGSQMVPESVTAEESYATDKKEELRASKIVWTRSAGAKIDDADTVSDADDVAADNDAETCPFGTNRLFGKDNELPEVSPDLEGPM